MDAPTIERIARTARWNGGSIVVVAGLSALIAAASGDTATALFGAAIATAGATEVHGGRLLARGAPRTDARRCLVGAELAVLVMIAGYAVWRLATADVALELAALPEDVRQMLVTVVGGDEVLLAQMLQFMLKLIYGTLIVVTLAYQGGLAWWYARRTAGDQA